MRALGLSEIQRTFTDLFASARSDMFKAEVLQDYSAVDDVPSLHAWVAGNMQKSIELGQKDRDYTDYRDLCLKSPAAVTRVHVIVEPLTPYLEWEIAVIYKRILIPSGAEKIYLAPSAKLNHAKLPLGDFWIFDDKAVLQWEYENGSGKTIGGRVWSEGEDISYFLTLRKTLLAIAHPIA